MATPSSGQPSTGAANTKWQDMLKAACEDRKLPPPAYQMYSDRRGGRTAWTCSVRVYGLDDVVQARNWYDGAYVNNAREDAAEVALRRIGASGQQPPQMQPQAVAGQQQQQQPSSSSGPQSPQQGGWFQ